MVGGGGEAGLGCEKLWSDSKIHTNMSTGDDVHTLNTEAPGAAVSQTYMFNQSGYCTLTSENQRAKAEWRNTEASIGSDPKIQDPSLMCSSFLFMWFD